MSENISASVHDRLLNQAHASGRTFNELLQYYSIERFLYRLSQSPYKEKFVLKGALIFKAWGVPLTRPTLDIDLLGFTSNAVEDVVEITRQICIQPVEPDGLQFDPESVIGERIKEDADYEGVRMQLKGMLGKSRIPIQIDVGFADVVSPAAVAVDYPTLLNMPAPHLRGYPKETVVAEKLQAIVFLGSINSRMKDYYDLWMMVQQFEFDSSKLRTAVEQTFQRRETDIPSSVPVGLSEGFAQEKQARWNAFLLRNKLEAPDLDQVNVDLRKFLLPLLITQT